MQEHRFLWKVEHTGNFNTFEKCPKTHHRKSGCGADKKRSHKGRFRSIKNGGTKKSYRRRYDFGRSFAGYAGHITYRKNKTIVSILYTKINFNGTNFIYGYI